MGSLLRFFLGFEDCYLTLSLGQILTCKGSDCWCSSGSLSGEGSPCASSIIELKDSRRAACRGQGLWKILAR